MKKWQVKQFDYANYRDALASLWKEETVDEGRAWEVKHQLLDFHTSMTEWATLLNEFRTEKQADEMNVLAKHVVMRSFREIPTATCVAAFLKEAVELG